MNAKKLWKFYTKFNPTKALALPCSVLLSVTTLLPPSAVPTPLVCSDSLRTIQGQFEGNNSHFVRFMWSFETSHPTPVQNKDRKL